MTLERTDHTDPEFQRLVAELDKELAERDGELHSFYAPLNEIEGLDHCVVAQDGGRAIGCGALKEYMSGVAEIKRMYTAPEHRERGIASTILEELEDWAVELSFDKCILETGLNQPEAIRLYIRKGYRSIAKFGPYRDAENSRCFEKNLMDRLKARAKKKAIEDRS